MAERFPPLEPVTTRVGYADSGAAGVGRTAVDGDATFVCVVRGLGPGEKSDAQVGRHIVDICMPLFEQRVASMLDDLAETWWKAEHEGARVRPFSSLPIGERADLRARVKRLLEERVADTLGDQAVLEGEAKRLLDLPAIALRRASADLERRAERPAWTHAAASAICAVFAAGRASIAHIGDCRAVRLRRGIYDVLTHEHVAANDVDALTRAVGHWGEGPEQVDVPIDAGDVFLFMTRGVHRPLPREVLLEALHRGPDAARHVVTQAHARATPRELCAAAVEIC